MIVDMRLRPPIKSWIDKPQFRKGAKFYPSRIGFPRPPSAENRSMALLIKEMNAADIQLGVIMGRQSAEPHGVIPNDDIADVMARYPGRFVSFAGIDVSRTTDWCLKEVDRCLENSGFKGVSIEPGASPTPMMADDERLYPLYEHCVSRGVPISVTLSSLLSHMAGYGHEFGSPLPLYKVARDFPNLPIIVSHGAWPWVREVLGLAFVAANIYLSPDLYMVGVNLPGANDYVKAANMYLSDRTLFGTAYPSRPLVESVRAFDDWTFAPGVKQKVLSQNALRVMKISD